MKLTNLVYVFNDLWQILLCTKKKTNSGFTVSLGKRNGAGGKVDNGESIVGSAIRELAEETWIFAQENDLKHMWIIHFSFETQKDRDQECHVYAIDNYTWNFIETEEMQPQRWNIKDIPYENMRSDDKYWMPRMLKWEFVEYKFYFNDSGEIINYQVIQ